MAPGFARSFSVALAAVVWPFCLSRLHFAFRAPVGLKHFAGYSASLAVLWLWLLLLAALVASANPKRSRRLRLFFSVGFSAFAILRGTLHFLSGVGNARLPMPNTGPADRRQRFITVAGG